MTRFSDPQNGAPPVRPSAQNDAPAPNPLRPAPGSPLPVRVPGYGAPIPLYSVEPPPAPPEPPASESAALPASPVDRVGSFLREMLQIALPAIVLAIVVHLFLAQATVVFGQSMEPNLSPHQRLIVDKLSYRLHSPQRNDIVVIDIPGMEELLVKRIVGLPGETMEVRDGAVLVDGAPLAEPFPHDLGHTNMAPLMLGPLEYFVMGDNRDNSNDSRAFGPVHRESIVGRVWLRYWPLDDMTLF